MTAQPEVVRAASDRLATAAADAKKRNRALPRPDVVVPKDNPGGLDRRVVTIKLIGGPADGVFTQVLGYGRVAWQRIDGPGDYPWFAKYVRSARGEYEWAEADPDAIIDAVSLAEKLAKNGRGRLMGSCGA